MIGLKERPQRDFARQLTRAGFVTLSIGTPAGDAWAPDRGGLSMQPLSYYAYVAANAWSALAAQTSMPHASASSGTVTVASGPLFAGALWDRFAAVATSDPGIVFDETRPNVKHWEPWYLGFDPHVPRRARGLPGADNPRTGPYKTMIETGRDLHELHALIAPRPFFVSGGSEDPSERWVALNHVVAVNRVLGFSVGSDVEPTDTRSDAGVQRADGRLLRALPEVG